VGVMVLLVGVMVLLVGVMVLLVGVMVLLVGVMVLLVGVMVLLVGVMVLLKAVRPFPATKRNFTKWPPPDTAVCTVLYVSVSHPRCPTAPRKGHGPVGLTPTTKMQILHDQTINTTQAPNVKAPQPKTGDKNL
jgi:hypothetical protein